MRRISIGSSDRKNLKVGSQEVIDSHYEGEHIPPSTSYEQTDYGQYSVIERRGSADDGAGEKDMIMVKENY